MPEYTYTAKNLSGETKQGTVDARAPDLAINLLKAQGLFVLNITERKESFLDDLPFFNSIPQSEVVSFTRQFSTMISAGLTVSRSLEVLGQQVTSKAFKKVIYDVLRAVEGGSSLSVALSRYPNVFSTAYQALVKAGESSGRLDEILKRLAETMESQRELNSRFKSAMIYPTIVLIAMGGVFILLMMTVVPKLAEMYKSMNVPLPFVTKAMISVSAFMVNNMIIMAVIIVAVLYGYRKFATSPYGKYLITELTFRLPVFGSINRQKEVAEFTSTLSLLMSSAVPIVDALNIVSSVMNSTLYRTALQDAAKQVEKGNSLSSFFKSSNTFPPLLSQMAGVGEETGKMDEVLERVSGYYAGEVDLLVKNLSVALEPIILVMLGTMVGFLIISIITPIYKITSAL